MLIVLLVTPHRAYAARTRTKKIARCVPRGGFITWSTLCLLSVYMAAVAPDGAVGDASAVWLFVLVVPLALLMLLCLLESKFGRLAAMLQRIKLGARADGAGRNHKRCADAPSSPSHAAPCVEDETRAATWPRDASFTPFDGVVLDLKLETGAHALSTGR